MSANRPPLWKQVAGAAVGGSLALALYAGYAVAEPQLGKLRGLLVLPQSRIQSTATGSVRIADNDLEPDEVERIAARAQRIAADLSGNSVNAAAPTEPMDQDPMPVQMVDVEPLANEQDIADAWEAMEAEDGEMMAEQKVWEDDTDYRAMMQYDEERFYGETGELPDSGIGAWLATLVAFGGATFYVVRRKRSPAAAEELIG